MVTKDSITTTVPSPTQELFIALHARTSRPVRTYHWALLICPVGSAPTFTTGQRYHATNSIQAPTAECPYPPQAGPDGRFPWRFEAGSLANLFTASPLVARVRISLLASHFEESAAEVLEGVPLVQNDRSWTCRTWVTDALACLARRGIIELPFQLDIVSMPDGRLALSEDGRSLVEKTCLDYLERKHAMHRWRAASEGRWVEGEVPTWDLAEAKEVVA